jgi:glutamate N-acetyltransferase/amino-acid N-acetyltransferase
MFSIFSLKGSIENINGFFCGAASAGLRPNGDNDVAFIYSDEPCDAAAIFTKNKFQAAPLRHFLSKPNNFKTNFLLVNAKNANAMTGEAGIRDTDDILNAVAEKFGNLQNPIMSSTGVIGVRMPKDKIINTALSFDLSQKNGDDFSRAIMTTDAYPKTIALEVKLENGQTFKIAAAAKGAGMINPSLATMLCFICTDADVPLWDMKELLQLHAHTTFNAISVDGDTSTNDTVLLLANKKSRSYNKDAFSEALKMVMEKIALDIVSDGEGAKKSVGFKVLGASSDIEAEIIAKALSNSLLVKTAIFGEDPNWGRIASTIGASGCECDESTLKISFGDVLVYDKGNILFDKDIEHKAAKVMQEERFVITCDIGFGNGCFIAYGCDLGYKYVEINADYRT